MSYYIVYGKCISCHVPMAYNPIYVPSIRVNNQGPKEPLCKKCFHLWNSLHRPCKPLEIHPLAYEPQKETDDQIVVSSKHVGESLRKDKEKSNE